ncbi:hypothetical protein OB2597_18811 [Pseudooceanicola batsensis HTCC2597]|uniref:Uncharacterized protein n=1 Tax=Pseudooceanicola batsensis (strain ATCC BAA-863 / DSM 15984 / KCTC 12145 / HTCC2597) TaxID=252305 RepID=A3U4A3_PSEBH|nr:hypothetical protein OB2597_18811 [Pseudooceanicola batsensis HTCC2597]
MPVTHTRLLEIEAPSHHGSPFRLGQPENFNEVVWLWFRVSNNEDRGSSIHTSEDAFTEASNQLYGEILRDEFPGRGVLWGKDGVGQDESSNTPRIEDT